MPKMVYENTEVDVAEGCVDIMLNRGYKLKDEEPTKPETQTQNEDLEDVES